MQSHILCKIFGHKPETAPMHGNFIFVGMERDRECTLFMHCRRCSVTVAVGRFTAPRLYNEEQALKVAVGALRALEPYTSEAAAACAEIRRLRMM